MPKRFSDLIAESGTGMKGRIVRIYVVLGLANIFCWAWAIMSFRHYPVLLGTSFLAYSFGLRHAVDADHIAAIDNITRKLMQEKKQPLNVGLFFSLGHSTIVIALSIAIAVTAVSVKSHLPGLETFGGLAGTLVSTGFFAGFGGFEHDCAALIVPEFSPREKNGCL